MVVVLSFKPQGRQACTSTAHTVTCAAFFGGGSGNDASAYGEDDVATAETGRMNDLRAA